MTAQLLLLDGTSLFLSQENGDAEANQPEGFFCNDVRHLSEWRLLIDGTPLEPLTSRAVDYFSGRVVAAPDGKDPPLTVPRDRFVANGVHEDVTISNNSAEVRLLRLELCFAADFADISEAQVPGAYGDRTEIDVGGRSVTLAFNQDGFRRATRITFNRSGDLQPRPDRVSSRDPAARALARLRRHHAVRGRQAVAAVASLQLVRRTGAGDADHDPRVA